MVVVPLQLPKHQHEEEAKAGLHHHPVHHAQQVDVRGQEHNVLPWLNGQVSVKQRTLQFLIFHWKLMQAYWLAGYLAEKIHVAGTAAGV